MVKKLERGQDAQSPEINSEDYPDYLKQMIKDLETSEKQKVPKWLENEVNEKNRKKREQIELEKRYLYSDEDIYIKSRDRQEFYATENQREIVEHQEAMLGSTLYTLMRRTENNPEIIKGLTELINALEHQANYGNSEREVGQERQKDVAEFLIEVAKALRWRVGGGNQPSKEAMPINLSKWG